MTTLSHNTDRKLWLLVIYDERRRQERTVKLDCVLSRLEATSLAQLIEVVVQYHFVVFRHREPRTTVSIQERGDGKVRSIPGDIIVTLEEALLWIIDG